MDQECIKGEGNMYSITISDKVWKKPKRTFFEYFNVLFNDLQGCYWIMWNSGLDYNKEFQEGKYEC